MAAAIRMNDVAEFYPQDRAQWRRWLMKNHARAQSVWVICYKKASQMPTISYDELVEECLCFGWVDSKPNKIDEDKFKLFCAQRKPTSAWSGLNKDRIDRLLAAGLMQPAGLAAIEVAKANGLWSVIDTAQRLEEPADLKAAFGQHAGAAKFWAAFPPSTRRAILEWISLAKTEATRTKRVQETASLAAQNIRANQWKPKTPT
jgi:uncharacterized protein YdeI (YjbR/CyaY-like superfamily)